METWIQNEMAACTLPDGRLVKRLGKVVASVSNNPGLPIPHACQDWSATKAAYRFLDNDRVNEQDILSGHFDATKERISASSGKILILQDTTEFSFKRSDPEKVGKLKKMIIGKDNYGRKREYTTCGIMMHASLAVTLEGLPLGLTNVKCWTRKQFKGTSALRGKVNVAYIPIEEKESIRWIESLQGSTEMIADPARCIHVGDREADIYELYSKATELKTHFVIRTCVNRKTDSSTVYEEMLNANEVGFHEIEIEDKKRKKEKVTLRVLTKRLKIRPPQGKTKKHSSLKATVIYAEEVGNPKDRDKIIWKLMTDLPGTSLKKAIEKLDWYAMRWNIETYFKVLKSGCKAEETQLRTANRIANLIAVYCIVGWRIFWLTHLNRTSPDTPASAVFTDTELKIMDAHAGRKKPRGKKTVSRYIIILATIGGYLNRNSDKPPGNKVIWRGMSRLIDIHHGFLLAKKLVGN